MKNTRKILLMVLLLALAACVLAVTAFAAEETPNADGSVTTEYGTFTPTAEQTATAYPIVVFKPDKSVLGLYTNWKTALDAAGKVNNSVVYLRADVIRSVGEGDVTILRGRTVSLTVDLNGHTLTKADNLLFSNYLSSSTATNTHVTFKNGTMAQRECDTDWRAFINYDYHTTNHQAASTMNYTFENVKFVDNRESVADQKVFVFAVSEYDATVPQISGKIIYNNCEFYSKGCYVFDCSSGKSFDNIDISIEVNGGKVVDSSGITLDKLIRMNDEGDSVVFGEYDGSYTEFVCPTSLAPTSDIYLKDCTSFERVLSAKGTDGDNTVCELVPVVEGEGVEPTPYTVITGLTGDKADKTKYPLAVFKKKGNMYTLADVYSSWSSAANVARKVDGSVIYFRSDFTNPEGTGSTDLDGYTASFTVDLNDKVFTKTDKFIFDIYINEKNATDIHVTVKNGTLVHHATIDGGKSRGFISYNYAAEHKNNDAYIDFTFENVKFKDERETNRAQFLITMNQGGNGTTGIKQTYGDIVFNNCEIYPSHSGAYIFNSNDSGNNIDLNYFVNGGKIIASNDHPMNKLVSIGAGDSVTFGNYNGQYTEFVYPNTVNISNTVSVTDDYGYTRMLVAKSTDGSNKVYELAEKTEYGFIKGLDTVDELADKSPLAVFKDNGDETYTFYKVYTTWYSALKDARTFNSVVYLRANLTRPGGEGGVDLDSFCTTVTVDLNGKTITKADKLLFDIYMTETEKITDIHITIKNGTLAQQDAPEGANWTEDWRAFVQYNYSSAHTAQKAIINFTFENVKLEDNRETYDTSKNNGFAIVAGGGGNDADGASKIKGTITYNNCEFYTNGVTIFHSYEKRDKIDLTYIVNGGKIVSKKNLTSSNIFTYNSNDSLTFGKYDGKYTTVELLNGATIEGSSWKTTDGIDCVFTETASGDYKLYPEVMVGYKIKTSVTLWSNFVYNVYIPKANVASFNVNGITKANEEIEIDGVLYYLVKVELPAPESLSDIAVCVTLNSGDTTVDANWTLSVLKYAKSVIGGSYDDTTKNLMRDMLVYASAAHTYFENELDAAKVNTITDLLDGYTRDLPTGDAKAPADKTYFTSATVYLGEVPSFRFYLAGDYTAEDFSFKVGNRSVTAKLGNDNDGYGNYLEVVMYAYMMLDDVTYTVTDKLTKESVTESYNLYSYYENADKANKNLIALVEGLMKYSVSAAAYRASVVEN